MKISIIGTGSVGQTLASALVRFGHDVMLGTRNIKDKLSDKKKDGYGNPSFSEWHKTNSKVKVGTFAESAAFGEIVINASNGGNSLSALKLADSKNLKDKLLIDIANPLDFSKGMPPSLLPDLNNTYSLGEAIQDEFPETHVVKTLNTMWSGLMVNPGMIGGGKHINFVSGNDPDAKDKVKKLLKELGWKDENLIDIGDIKGARATEGVLPIWLRLMGTLNTGAFNFAIVK